MESVRKSINLPVKGVNVSYSEAGADNKPVMIFIHGFPFNKSIWDYQLEILGEHYHVIAYDVRGHGNSVGGDQAFSIELFAEDLIAFMDALHIDHAVFCGHSMGGYIALNAIEKYPTRFEALVLVDTQSKSDNGEAKEKRMKAIELIKSHGVEDYAEQSVKNLFAYISFSSKREEIAAVKDLIINTPVDTLEKTLHALAERKDVTNKLSDIKIPVLIIVGKKDVITPPAVAERMHEKIEDSTLELIDYAGHLPNLENALDFNRLLKKFMDKITAYDRQPYFERVNHGLNNPNVLEMVATKINFHFQRWASPFKKFA